MGGIPAIALETSAAIAYLNGEDEWEEVEELVRLAEGAKISILMSDFTWREIKPHPAHDTVRLERLRSVGEPLPNVARVGEWILGVDVLGHDASSEIEKELRSLSTPDIEQFLSYCAQHHKSVFFVTKDRGFLKAKAKREVHAKFGFQVGKPADYLEWLRRQKLV